MSENVMWTVLQVLLHTEGHKLPVPDLLDRVNGWLEVSNIEVTEEELQRAMEQTGKRGLTFFSQCCYFLTEEGICHASMPPANLMLTSLSNLMSGNIVTDV